jgi:hypothetical protein
MKALQHLEVSSFAAVHCWLLSVSNCIDIDIRMMKMQKQKKMLEVIKLAMIKLVLTETKIEKKI